MEGTLTLQGKALGGRFSCTLVIGEVGFAQCQGPFLGLTVLEWARLGLSEGSRSWSVNDQQSEDVDIDASLLLFLHSWVQRVLFR